LPAQFRQAVELLFERRNFARQETILSHSKPGQLDIY
jgi:hypothetical protein